MSSVTSTSTSLSRANELRLVRPHLVWSASTTTRRATRMKVRLVSASARLGVVSPASASKPWQPRNSTSKCSERMVRSAIGPTSASGGVRTPSDALVGPIADLTIRSLHFDVLFLGCHGFDADAGLTTPNLAEAETNRTFIRVARRVVVLADHTKWGL